MTYDDMNILFLILPHPPPRWREVLDSIRTARSRRTASVDDFHGFLLGLRDAPDPHFQALVATLLSVQCRDSVALVAMRRLQSALGGAATLAAVRAADVAVIEDAVSCCNYKRTKAKYVKETADEVHLRFGGVVPHEATELQRLPGVGPKIAHLVASVAFGLDRSGVVVDTHVRRVSERLGWTSGRACVTAESTRVHLERWLPPDLWAETTLLLVGFGQETCTPRMPRCDACPVSTACPSSSAFAFRGGKSGAAAALRDGDGDPRGDGDGHGDGHGVPRDANGPQIPPDRGEDDDSVPWPGIGNGGGGVEWGKGSLLGGGGGEGGGGGRAGVVVVDVEDL